MKKTIVLTDEQYQTIIGNELRTEKLTKNELEIIATKINKKINIPLIGEEKEQMIISKIVNRMDKFIYDNLPDEVYGLIHTMDDGIIDEKEFELIKERISKLINNFINIPIINEKKEEKIINIFLNIIFNSMKKGNSIIKSKENDLIDNCVDKIDDAINNSTTGLDKEAIRKLINNETKEIIEKHLYKKYGVE